jgi:hypothetical protein
MIQIEQTRLKAEEGGNCYAACLASIFEVPLEAVPQPTPATYANNCGGWLEYQAEIDAWLRGRNLFEVGFPAGDNGWFPKGYAIAQFESPRIPGLGHAVVTLDGEIVWDPHPERAQEHGRITHWYVYAVLDPTAPTSPPPSPPPASDHPPVK